VEGVAGQQQALLEIGGPAAGHPREVLPAGGGLVRTWASWNYGGLETKDSWPTFRALVMPLKGTPGRLANDLSPDNERFGSSRIFELVPSLIGKPILEGGLVKACCAGAGDEAPRKEKVGVLGMGRLTRLFGRRAA